MDVPTATEVLEGGALGGGEEGVVLGMGRREVVLMVVVVVLVVFLGVMLRWCLLHVEEEIWREEGGGRGRHAIAGHWLLQRRTARGMGSL